MSNPDITIPREVVEAMRREFGTSLDWAAALRAAINAWPEMEIDDSQYGGDFIILPVTQEVGDE